MVEEESEREGEERRKRRIHITEASIRRVKKSERGIEREKSLLTRGECVCGGETLDSIGTWAGTPVLVHGAIASP